MNQREIYHVGNDQHDAEFWGPISCEIPIGNFQNYNLQYYIRNYWIRTKRALINGIDPVLDVVAPGLYLSDCEYDCLEFVNSRVKKLTHFVTVMLPADLNARRLSAIPVLVWRRFFAEIVLFFAHTYCGNNDT